MEDATKRGVATILADAKRAEIIASIMSATDDAVKARGAAIADFGIHEDGLGLAFKAEFKDRLRYCHNRGSWFVWNGSVWRRDETCRAFSWARDVCRQIAAQNGKADRAVLAKAATAGAVERFAKTDNDLAVKAAYWDADPYKLGTPDGTVDLRTGALSPGVPSDGITKQTAVAPSEGEDCPRWLRFLHEAMRGDQEMIAFFKRWVGYCLTGDTKEHALLFVYGPGGNGKSVFLDTIASIMGDYSVTADMDVFTAAKGERHPTDLAGLAGARMVSVSETAEGKAWAETRIKQLTGGDRISARFMRQDFFEFRPQFKLFIVGNNQPVLHTVDDAMARRFNIAPFVHKPETVDPDLGAKLRDEWPGILRWAIHGCLEWQQTGLKPPKAIVDATHAYLSDQNILPKWLEDCCDTGKGFADTNGSLIASYTNWARHHGEDALSGRGFNAALQRLGYAQIKDAHGIRGRGFRGLRVNVGGPGAIHER